MNPSMQVIKAALVFVVTLVSFGLLPTTQAVIPPPDGGYPGGNTAEGQNALLSLSSGGYNTAIGFVSLRTNTTSSFNTAIGAGALFSNIADENTATGAGALLSNTNGDRNTANGAFVLFNNTTGTSNTGDGWRALFQNTTGARNTAGGRQALLSNTTGFENTATGSVALQNNTTGNDNTATGFAALNSNTTGALNTANGTGALVNSTGDLNVALGFAAGVNLATGNNNIDVGNVGVPRETNAIRIGAQIAVTDQFGVLHPAHSATYIAGIRDATTGIADAIPVLIDSAGQLGTISSSRRFKSEIRPMDKESEPVLALKPITFHYKSDSKGTTQFGLIAEEVAKVNPDLVVRDRNGEIYSVRYDAVNAMLLNEFLKEHRKNEQRESKIQEQAASIARLKSTVSQQQKGMEAVTARLNEQAAQIQKVSAQIEASKPAPQVVNNP